jgi:3-oxoacyl-[acyl-carrier-protein] synthase-3
MIEARITAIGTYVPEKKLTNFELEQMVETNNEWIIQGTGIRERRISRPDEFTSDLCIAAVNDLMHRYNKKVEDVDMIIVATSSRFSISICRKHLTRTIKYRTNRRH